MSKRIMALSIVLVLLLLVCSCGSGTPTGEEQNTVAFNLADWVIVYPTSSVALKGVADALRDSIYEKSGVLLNTSSDYQSGDGRREILVGETNRGLSDALYGKLTAYEFRICMGSDKIAIGANYQTLIERAADYIVANFVQGQTLSLPENLNYTSEQFEFIELAVDRKSEYQIIYSETADEITKQYIRDFVMYVADLGGVNLGTEVDQESAEVPGSKEILIGLVDREESREAYAGLAYHEYCVEYVNGKLAVCAWSPIALGNALNALEQILQQNIVDKNICLDTALLSFRGETSDLSDMDLPAFEGGTLEAVIDCNDGVQQLYITETDADDFIAYGQQLQNDGYVLYQETAMGSNRYGVYNHAERNQSVFVNYTASEAVTRVIVSPLETMLPKEPENTAAVTNAAFTMMDLGNLGNGQNEGEDAYGASFVIRLTDGRFVVIDGGTNTSNEVTKLYRYLSENNVRSDGIVIAAWILTHPHGDHFGLFKAFASRYQGSVRLEKILYNQFSNSMTSGLSESALQTALNVHNQYIPSIATSLNCETIVKLHTGQKFYLGNVLFEILYTHEDLYPAILQNVNDSSIVMKVTIGDRSFLLTADIEAAATRQLLSQMGDSIQADYIQVAHHGWSGSNSADILENSPQYSALYQRSGADYALWTAQLDDYHYNLLNGGTHMSFVRRYIPHIISTKDGIFTIELSDE